MRVTKKFRQDLLVRINKFRLFGISESDCYGWCGAKCGRGYARISVNGKSCGAARAAYTADKGKVRPGLLVRARCDNRLCTNPAHLYVTTSRRTKKLHLKRSSNRQRRRRLSVDIPTKLIQGVKMNSKKRNITVTKYMTILLTRALAIEESYE